MRIRNNFETKDGSLGASGRILELRRFIPEPDPTSNLRNHVLESLGQAICRGDLHEGDVLNMDEIAARFKVSRSVVREACGVLAARGLVVSRRRVGTLVQGVGNWELFNGDVIRWRLNSPDRANQILELAELRSSLEPAAAALAAIRATPEERAEVDDCARRLVEAGTRGDIPAFHELDKVFHTLVMTAGHNRMFAQMHHVIEDLLESRYRQGLMPEQVANWALAWHEELGRAVVAGDPGAAVAAAERIVAASAEEMLELARLAAH